MCTLEKVVLETGLFVQGARAFVYEVHWII